MSSLYKFVKFCVSPAGLMLGRPRRWCVRKKMVVKLLVQNNITMKKEPKPAGAGGSSSPHAASMFPPMLGPDTLGLRGLVATKWISTWVSRPQGVRAGANRELQREFITVQAGKQLCQGGRTARCPWPAACPGGQGQGILGCTWMGDDGRSGREF